MKPLYLLLALPLLPACSLIGFVAKESVVGATSHYGLSSTTLIAELPPNHGVTYNASYAPLDPYRCTVASPATGGMRSRPNQYRTDQADAHPDARTVTFRIPLTYTIGSCTQQLDNITVSIKSPSGRYSLAGVNVLPALPDGTGPVRDADPELVVRRLCGTAYHIVPGHERHVLARDIDCLAADSQWQPLERTSRHPGPVANVAYTQLNKTDLRFVYRLIDKEWPLYPENWSPVGNGMKPCASQWKWVGEASCSYRDPTFSTFQMDGRECALYPGCTE